MNFWTAIVLIVIIGNISGIYSMRLKSRRLKAREQTSSNMAEKLEERIKRLEVRMANIETIILDKEKADRFKDL